MDTIESIWERYLDTYLAECPKPPPIAQVEVQS